MAVITNLKCISAGSEKRHVLFILLTKNFVNGVPSEIDSMEVLTINLRELHNCPTLIIEMVINILQIRVSTL